MTTTPQKQVDPYDLAEMFGVGRWAFESDVLKEAARKQVSIRSIQEGGDGTARVHRINFTEAPSRKLRQAILDQLHGHMVEDAPWEWIVTSNTNVAAEGSVRWVQSLVQAGYYLLSREPEAVKPKVTKDGWRQYPTGHTFVSWDVGRIVLASNPDVILYPPLVVNRSQYGSVPVHTGVTIQPGDTDQEAITRALERLQYMPQLRGRALGELRLQVQPDR